ncbi:hypothetical protein BJ973_002464 [Actinoplanes tereljensis]|uniref:hypothetical protein n=1 Tax=Paractinoplanes tereljensis TaxID=571912 RepID=UPI00194201AA|nr:hypothetical protein [Actinoplanes tereljensis]
MARGLVPVARVISDCGPMSSLSWAKNATNGASAHSAQVTRCGWICRRPSR